MIERLDPFSFVPVPIRRFPYAAAHARAVTRPEKASITQSSLSPTLRKRRRRRPSSSRSPPLRSSAARNETFGYRLRRAHSLKVQGENERRPLQQHGLGSPEGCPLESATTDLMRNIQPQISRNIFTASNLPKFTTERLPLESAATITADLRLYISPQISCKVAADSNGQPSGCISVERNP